MVAWSLMFLASKRQKDFVPMLVSESMLPGPAAAPVCGRYRNSGSLKDSKIKIKFKSL